MISTPVTLRLEKGNTPALFFYEAGGLLCFTEAEGHCIASVGYLQQKTKPGHDNPDCLKLFHKWCGLGGVDQSKAHIVKRLNHKGA